MSDLALKLIAENKRTRSTTLDLGRCGLKKLPQEIGELTWLESLTLSDDWYEWNGTEWIYHKSQNEGPQNKLSGTLSPLVKLTQLKSLILCDTQIVDLSPLAGSRALRKLNANRTPIIDLAPLSGLKDLQTLDVSDTQIADLSPLAGLKNLQTLNVSRTQITDLSPLAGLKDLQTLDVSSTRIADLSPLARLTALQKLNAYDTQVADLAPLASLKGLRDLNVSKTHVSDMSPIVSLTSLRRLYFSSTPVKNLVHVAKLTALRELGAADTSIADISPLETLTALQTLIVAETPIADLSSLANLVDLRKLAAGQTQITDLSPLLSQIGNGIPVHAYRQVWADRGIYLEDCPLTNPPPEIVKQGNEAILNYFREREVAGVDHLYEAKMLIIGAGRAGKTSLLRRLYLPDKPMPDEKDTTKGIDIYRHEFTLPNGRKFRLNVWDFAGQEIYHATHQFFLTRRSLYLLVDDTSKDHKSVSDEGFKYWLELVDVFGGGSPLLIFQNEKGGRTKAIDFAGIVARFHNVKQCLGGNLEHLDSGAPLRRVIEKFAATLSHIGEELPARWIKVRKEIESRATDVPFLDQQEYFDIYARHMAFDRAKALHLSQYLHDLGVFLHFQDDKLLQRTVILQNQWATEAVFRVLDNETVKKQLGRFTQADCERHWSDTTYAEKHPELLALMKRFELCYELRDSDPPTWLAPQLLPPAKPATLTGWAQPGDLILRYRFDFLPKGMISRLIVRLHRFVKDPEQAWTTGVLFEQGNTSLLTEVLPKGDEIELRARGPEAHGLLSIVAGDLDALNESFNGLRDKVHKSIPCNCDQCRAITTPHFFPHKALLRRKEDKRLKVECPNSYADVDVLELLDGVRFSSTPSGSAATSYRLIRIFLASSSELADDRDAFELYFLQQNSRLRQRGVFLEVIRWENFLDAMSDTRLQDEYNKEIRACDLFVSLFFTKTGKYTEEEFDAAHRQFKETTKPAIYTYFKDGPYPSTVRAADLASKEKFQEKLSDLGHFYTRYKNIDDLKLQVANQIDKLLDANRL